MIAIRACKTMGMWTKPVTVNENRAKNLEMLRMKK